MSSFMLPFVPSTLVWYVGHGVLYWWFSVFISPMKESDRANVTYFWVVSFSTLLMLIASISHAPRLFHATSSRLIDTVAFAWAVLPFVALSLEIMSRISRRVFGYTLTVPVRVLFSNALLVTIALGFQYMACLDNGFFSVHVAQSGSVTEESSSYISSITTMSVASLHCKTIESPVLIYVPIVITVLIVLLLSQLVDWVTGYKFFQTRHIRDGFRWFVKSGTSQTNGPIQLPMVPWFSLSLTSTAIQLLVTAKIFIGRLDIRHILRSLCKDESDILFDLRDGSSEWIDFFADGGDGFNSTYCVARMLAQPNLPVQVPRRLRLKLAATCVSNGQNTPKMEFSNEGKAAQRFSLVTPPLTDSPARAMSAASLVIQRRVTSTNVLNKLVDEGNRYSPAKNDLIVLPRASIVVHGGDLAYPRPSNETYKTRFAAPLEAAFSGGNSACKPGGANPNMFLVPGNHDWYDSCESFIKWVIGRTSLGGWMLPQKNSYFSLQLRGGWWLFGLDLGLTNDLDVFQYEVFCNILEKHVKIYDRVIVVCHRPQWIFDPYHAEITGDLFHQLLDKIGLTRLALRLAGDIHNYSRFSGGPGLPSLVVSGGAGAFLHPTHVPEESVVHEYFRDVDKHRDVDLLMLNEVESDEEVDPGDGSPNSFKKRTFPKRTKSALPYYRYTRTSTYPSVEVSRRLTYLNPLHFRDRNWGADIVFGVVYVLMGISIIPVCGADRVVGAESFLRAIQILVVDLIVPSLKSIWTTSFLSLGFQVMFFTTLFVATGKTRHSIAQRLLVALVHCCLHVIAAVTIFCLLEVGVAFLTYASEGRDSVLTDGFRIPGLVTHLDQQISEYFPEFQNFLKHALEGFVRFMDLPSSLIRNRSAICQVIQSHQSEDLSGTLLAIPRPLLFRYFSRIVPVFWLMATPVAALITGCYLLVTLNWLGMHINEAFSSLRIEDYKHFIRMRINPTTNDLHVYVIGVDQVPKQWELDPAWDPNIFLNANQPVPSSVKWVTPSKWRPKGSSHTEPKLVDFFVVPAGTPREN